MWKLLKIEIETEPKCWHCSTAIKYACWVENLESGELICVGRECCAHFLAHRQVRILEGKCKDLLKAEKVRLKVYAITEELLERARLCSVLLQNDELFKAQFPAEYSELIK